MANSIAKTIYFITGASGVGKTTLVANLEEKYKGMPWAFLHFDSIGVPSVEEMERQYGSGPGWQEAKTHEWIERFVHDVSNEIIFLEGQVNPKFIVDAFEKYHVESFKIVLLDCSEGEMQERLTTSRMQPELFNPRMVNWLRFLRGQAEALDIVRIDTTGLSKKEVLKEFENCISL